MIDDVASESLLLNIPGATRGEREENYTQFVEAAHEYFPAGLPETIKGARFLTFDATWQPRVDRIRKPAKNSPAWVAQRLTQLLV